MSFNLQAKNLNSLYDKIRLLIVDDYPLTIRGYRAVLQNFKESSLDIDEAHGIDECLALIKKDTQSRFYDVIFLDISLPSSENDSSLISGEDLGIRIKNSSHDTKIIVITSLNNNYRISCILKNLNPDGFLIKSDLNETVLLDALKTVLLGNVYYSFNIGQLIRKRNTTDIHLDDLDRRILFLLSMGEKTKNLPKKMPLSLSTIERKKKKMKISFDINGEGDGELIQKAKEMGFI